MKMTQAMFDAGRSEAGGYNLKQISTVLADMPERGWPKTGWPARIVGSEVTFEQYRQFMELRGNKKERAARDVPELFEANKGKLWCAMCGKYGDHQSGKCPELYPSMTKPTDTTPAPKRYDPIQRFDQGGTGRGDMEECADGDYVKHEDIDALTRERDALRAFIRAQPHSVCCLTQCSTNPAKQGDDSCTCWKAKAP